MLFRSVQAKNYNLSISSIEKDNPILLHGPISAAWAEEKFNIQNQDILNSIKNHTHGWENMSILEKIIYVADFTEIERNFEEAKLVRKVVGSISRAANSRKKKEILDKAVVKKADFMLRYARKNK